MTQPQANPGQSADTVTGRKRLWVLGAGVCVIGVIALVTFLMLSGGPYATPRAAVDAYISSVEGDSHSTLHGEIAEITVAGASGDARIEWSGSHLRSQVVVLGRTSKFAGLREGWVVLTDGTDTGDAAR